MAGEIAKAYVQIIPSAAGMKAKLAEAFGSEMPGAGKNAGGMFSSGLISTIKTAIATAGIGTAIKESLMAGADLQQSLGGIETLFKDSASTVIANAEQAYKTAGMPANAYMESVTGFSASLLQGLSGDTAKAAEIADMALTDMSDNANKMGTGMESIRDAYQGFAKQNYTMLDNLKLGYGGTKTEMERLLADAEKLTGVKYDINNLADVYSAIHAIQEEMDITGTTAKEASSTLTGSFNAMKAAATDVLGNLALGKEMEPSLNALAETTATFLTGNLVPAVWNIVTALPGSLVTFINALLPDNMSSIATTAVGHFSAFFAGQLPNILNDGVQMITQLVAGFLSGTPDFLASARNLLNQLLTAVLSALPSMLSSGATLIMNLVSGLLSGLPGIISSAATIVAQLLATFAEHLPDLLAQGISMIGQLVAGLLSMIPDVISSAGDIAADILDTIKETDWLGLGIDIVKGIISGLWEAATSLYNAVRDIIKGALSAGKDEAEVNSPSRLFRRELGYQLPAGAALGVMDGVPLLKSAVSHMHAVAVDPFAAGLRINAGGYSVSGSLASGGYGRSVNVVQNIYSEAKSAADMMREARYQQELAVMMGV